MALVGDHLGETDVKPEDERTGLCALLWYVLSVFKMCFDIIFCRQKNEVEYCSSERTVTVHSPDGGKVVTHIKEVVEKGKLKEAEHSVIQWPGANTPGGEVKVWSRQYGAVK